MSEQHWPRRSPNATPQTIANLIGGNPAIAPEVIRDLDSGRQFSERELFAICDAADIVEFTHLTRAAQPDLRSRSIAELMPMVLQGIKARSERQDRLTNWFAPERPDARMIELIHRGHDGFIPVVVRDPKTGRPDGASLPASMLPGLWDQMIHDLEVDAYFGIHGMYKGERWPNKKGYVDADGKLLPAALRKNSALRWLTACFVDLDCHALGRSTGQIIGEVYDRQATGLIPAPSILTCSGRGVWCFWILDDGAGRPIRSLHNLESWNRIQTAIGVKCAEWGSDPKARDGARITRVPGSQNPKAPIGQRRVAYLPFLDQHGKPFSYSLAELAIEFGVDLTPKEFKATPRDHRQAIAKPTSQPVAAPQRIAKDAAERKPSKATPDDKANGARGRITRYRTLLDNFQTLWRLRGKWQEGTRNAAVFTLANVLAILRRANQVTMGQEAADLEALFRDLAQGKHAYSRDEFDATVNSARNMKIYAPRNQFLADQFDVTPEEAAQLPTWPMATRFGVTPKKKISRAEKIAARRQAITAHNAASSRPPTLANYACYLATVHGITASHQTINTDLAALGMITTRPRRPRRTQTSPLFPEGPPPTK